MEGRRGDLLAWDERDILLAGGRLVSGNSSSSGVVRMLKDGACDSFQRQKEDANEDEDRNDDGSDDYDAPVGFSHFGLQKSIGRRQGRNADGLWGMFRRPGKLGTSHRLRKLTSALRRRRKQRGRSEPSLEARGRKEFVPVLRVGLRISFSITSGGDSSRLRCVGVLRDG